MYSSHDNRLASGHLQAHACLTLAIKPGPNEDTKMKLFFNHSSGSICFGLFPIIGWALDWRDAEDGTTLIWPTVHRIKYARGL